MKRIFKTMLLALVLIGGGMSVTSCDEETISQILGLLLGGTTYTYSGTATLECFGPGENGGFREIVKGTASLQPSITSASDNTCTLVIPAFKLGDVTVNQMSFGGLVLTANSASTENIISISEQNGYSVDGTMIYDGVEHQISGLFIKEGSKASTKSTSFMISVYFDEAGDYAVNVTFSGESITNQ